MGEGDSGAKKSRVWYCICVLHPFSFFFPFFFFFFLGVVTSNVPMGNIIVDSQMNNNILLL